jgi:2-oxoglutarate ferredoxin oxidoreductase subunit gamma
MDKFTTASAYYFVFLRKGGTKVSHHITKAEIAMAGMGGQGVLTIGHLVANAALSVFENVSWFPTYETWQRGGKVYCCIILSDEEILSPMISRPEVLFVLDEPSLDDYEDSLVEGGLLVYDTTLIEREIKRKDIRVLSMPSAELAQGLGSIQVGNLILLGAYLADSKVLPMDIVESALEEMLKKGNKEGFLPLNKKALRLGFERFSGNGTES